MYAHTRFGPRVKKTLCVAVAVVFGPPRSQHPPPPLLLTPTHSSANILLPPTHTPTHTQKTEHWSPDLHCLQLMALMAQMRKSICAPKRRAARPLSAHQLATAPRKLAKFGRWVVFVNVYVYVRFRHFLCHACRHTHWRCY